MSLERDMLTMKDIHLPDSGLWWPLAPGWWLIILIGLFILGLSYQKLKRKRQSNARDQNSTASISEALQHLDTLQDESNNNPQCIKDVSILLRRTAMSLHGRKKVAGLTGEQWLQFLDKTGQTQGFTQGKGRHLIDQPYQDSHLQSSTQKLMKNDAAALISITRQWITSQRKYLKPPKPSKLPKQSDPLQGKQRV